MDRCSGPAFVPVHQDDELAQPLIAELAVEYAARYNGTEARVLTWLRGYPAEEFSPPDGGMLIGLVDGQPVTGGAFRRFDADTAELKRIWTDSSHRRRGYAKGASRGAGVRDRPAWISAVYLTTGTASPRPKGSTRAPVTRGWTRRCPPTARCIRSPSSKHSERRPAPGLNHDELNPRFGMPCAATR